MRRAFTIIELLVCVAIVAILAAIALPNFLAAQARAKTSRAKSDMRTLATALEAYIVDNNKFPLCNNNITAGRRPKPDGTIPPGEKAVLERLSSPISYVAASLIEDPFRPDERTRDHDAAHPQGAAVESIEDTGIGTSNGYNPHWVYKYGAFDPAPEQESGFANTSAEVPKGWILYSGGPDRNYAAMGTLMRLSQPPSVPSAQLYDPTNGTISYGDIHRVYPGALARHGFAGEFVSQVLRQD